ncbi:hypothetical protein NDU88_001965 [Pleurodeles waltl]|uniref:Uncharacterized protein n=1 Tax=Pleurodeles waltl TaxID=8319 RepID=A0AAV7NCA3_PLEWA|nr:hypothetical protein NDU88_001965 [Pleurodeles waltl]
MKWRGTHITVSIRTQKIKQREQARDYRDVGVTGLQVSGADSPHDGPDPAGTPVTPEKEDLCQLEATLEKHLAQFEKKL